METFGEAIFFFWSALGHFIGVRLGLKQKDYSHCVWLLVFLGALRGVEKPGVALHEIVNATAYGAFV